MAEANRAYHTGDFDALRRLLDEYQDGRTSAGEEIGAELRRIIRQIIFGQHPGRRAFPYRVERPPNSMRRVARHHQARYQPVEQHADAGKMMLDVGWRHFAAQALDIARHMHPLHILLPVNALPFALMQESSGSAFMLHPKD